uniref:Uncharacterized protein n=1 Tax=Rhizophora mucronata TaxID=61149 RepID=A0A2P2PM30_RHIMU
MYQLCSLLTMAFAKFTTYRTVPCKLLHHSIKLKGIGKPTIRSGTADSKPHLHVQLKLIS